MARKLGRIGFAVLIYSIIFQSVSLAQVTGVEKAEAMFIYNFSRLIEWPPEYRTGTFVIGILGASDLFPELVTYTTGKKVGFQDIQVKKFKTTDEIVKCHVLFISHAKSSSITEVAGKIANYSTLLISEKPGTIEIGAAINFLIVNNKLQFELKPENATRYNLKISQKLKEMAVTLY